MTRPNSIVLIAALACACSGRQDKTNEPGTHIAGASEQHIRKADKEEVLRHRKLYEAADTFYQRVLLPAGFNGGMIVAKNGLVLFERYNGLKRLERPDSMDARTPLHIASVSKTFTAMAVLKLQESGRLRVSDRVDSLLPGFPFKGITVRDLLNHRSGLPNYVHFMEDLGWNSDSLLTNRDLLRFMSDHRERIQADPPGRHFSYSNTNYAVLAMIIEKVSGKPYDLYLKETFFLPLGMADTYVYSKVMSDYAVPSYTNGGKEEPMGFLDAVYGDKNIYSTPRDLFIWDQALYPGRMFTQATLDSAFKGYSHEKPGIRNYGLGWRLLEPPSGKRIVFHNGWWHGNNAVFNRLPSDSAVIIVLGNRFTRRIYEARRIFDAFDGYAGASENEE
jgi:CubicO group peptidase (beta-lactamase class C family)